MDTSNILFITGGAFHGLESVIETRLDTKKIRIIPELIGRLPIIAPLHDLDEAALKKILTLPKNALTKQFQKLLKMDNIKLTFKNDAIELIAKIAQKRKVGARALRAIIEEIIRSYVRRSFE